MGYVSLPEGISFLLFFASGFHVSFGRHGVYGRLVGGVVTDAIGGFLWPKKRNMGKTRNPLFDEHILELPPTQ